MSLRSGRDESRSAYDARVVLEVLGEATTGGILDKVRESLPEDLRHLVDAGSSGPLQ